MWRQMPFWCFFEKKEQKCAWGQPASQHALSCEFSGKVIFLNLSCCWWGIHEMWAEAQRLHVKQYGAFAAHQSDWFYQNHLYPSSGGQESYICKCLPCWEAEWDIKPHKLKKDYCPCTSPFLFLLFFLQINFALTRSMKQQSGSSHTSS